MDGGRVNRTRHLTVDCVECTAVPVVQYGAHPYQIFPKLEGVGVGDVYDVAKREALRPEELSKINKRGR